MAFLDMKGHAEQHKFDWDNINVGNTDLDHSQNFFTKKHYEHEMEFLQQKMIKNELNDFVENKRNVDDKECVDAKSTSTTDKQNEETILSNTSLSSVKVMQEEPRKVVPNLASEWSTKKSLYSKGMTSKGAISKSMPPPPQAYLVKEIYQRNREAAERRRDEEERKLRQFHSRPVPNFNHHHQLLQKRGPVHAATIPVTPQVLKKSREAEEKRRKMLEDWKQKNQPPKFEARPPSVLKEKPFVPEKKPLVIQQCPFKLLMEKRIKERKQFDEIKKKDWEEKQKQEEEQRKRLEKQYIKELRKATSFKATPNPFKK